MSQYRQQGTPQGRPKAPAPYGGSELSSPRGRLLIAAARFLVVLVAVGLFIKVGPTIASHAAVHSATYQVRH